MLHNMHFPAISGYSGGLENSVDFLVVFDCPQLYLEAQARLMHSQQSMHFKSLVHCCLVIPAVITPRSLVCRSWQVHFVVMVYRGMEGEQGPVRYILRAIIFSPKTGVMAFRHLALNVSLTETETETPMSIAVTCMLCTCIVIKHTY